MDKKLMEIVKKMVLQLKAKPPQKDIKKLNLQYNRQMLNILSNQRYYGLLDVLDDTLIFPGENEFNEWVHCTIDSELNRIARDGRASIKFNISYEEYTYLTKKLKELMQEA